uniref:Putative secreted protein n=1 Tax=Amblyomma triste TaxID=251400 RepID=A0A023G9U9_AMBTT
MKLTSCLALLFVATADLLASAAGSNNKAVRCTPPYEGKGYGKAYNYKCSLTTGTYPKGTPCLPVDNGGKQKDRPGLCKKNKCKPHYDLGAEEEVCVFPFSLAQCPEKEHTGKNALQYCTYTCKIKNEWYFGYYKSHGVSKCIRPDSTNELGACCYGKCLPKNAPCPVPN